MYRASLPGGAAVFVTTRDEGDFSHHVVAPACASVHQVHGNRVIAVDEFSRGNLGDADAMVTRRDDVVLAVRGADCPLIGIASNEGHFGAVHAGWRGLVAGVIEAAAFELRARGATKLFAAVGPFVGTECYEFSTHDLAPIASHFGDAVKGSSAMGTPALDLRACLDAAFLRADVEPVSFIGSCTSCSPEFYSWRKDHDQSRHGLMITRDDSLIERSVG